MKRLFIRSGVEPAYINFNDGKRDSIYIVAAGARKPATISWLRSLEGNKIDTVEERCIGKQFMNRGDLISWQANRIIGKLLRLVRRP